MTVWNNCKTEIIYYNEDPAETLIDTHQVRIDGSEILVSYEDDQGIVEYRGKENGDGHFELTAPDRDGRASLHRFPDGTTLEGFWLENGRRGMWRIMLR